MHCYVVYRSRSLLLRGRCVQFCCISSMALLCACDYIVIVALLWCASFSFSIATWLWCTVLLDIVYGFAVALLCCAAIVYIHVNAYCTLICLLTSLLYIILPLWLGVIFYINTCIYSPLCLFCSRCIFI